MKRLDRVKKYKRIVAVIIIFLLTACTELGFNYPAIKYGQTEIDLSSNIKRTGAGDKQKYKISFENEKGIYVKQLCLSGSFIKHTTYTIKTVEINPFGKEEEQEYKDVVHAYFSNFYTNLNKRVHILEITLPIGEGANLTSVKLLNMFEVNKYRVLFFFVLFLIFYCILFEKTLRRRIEWLFALFVLLFGMTLLVCAQPQRNSWDEQNHFAAAYRVASGKTARWTEATGFLTEAQELACNTKAEFAQLRQLMDEKGQQILSEDANVGIGISRITISYIPIIVFLKMGMLFGMSFSDLYMFGKIGNLLVYIIVMFWAIRLAKGKKLFLAFIAMMPTSIFLAVSYTYDSVAFSFITLGSVLWGNEMFFGKDIPKKGTIIAAAALIIIGSSSKLVYIPLVLAIVLLPQCCIFIKRHKKVFIILGGVGTILFLAVAVSPSVKKIVLESMDFSDSRGGDTSVIRQLASMFSHPWESIKLFFCDIFRLDNFRNTGYSSKDDFLVTNMMFLNYHQWGVLEDKWSLLLLPSVLLLLLHRGEEGESRKTIGLWKKMILVFLLFVSVLFIWLVMYLAFTPVGDDSIMGVQARYYLPLLYFAVILIENRKIYLQAEYDGVMKATMLVALILQVAAIYELVLVRRLF